LTNIIIICRISHEANLWKLDWSVHGNEEHNRQGLCLNTKSMGNISGIKAVLKLAKLMAIKSGILTEQRLAKLIAIKYGIAMDLKLQSSTGR